MEPVNQPEKCQCKNNRTNINNNTDNNINHSHPQFFINCPLQPVPYLLIPLPLIYPSPTWNQEINLSCCSHQNNSSSAPNSEKSNQTTTSNNLSKDKIITEENKNAEKPIPMENSLNADCNSKLRYSPTLKVTPGKSAACDANSLKIALDSLNFHTIANILTHRTADQIIDICHSFEEETSHPLWKELKRQLSDPFLHLIMCLIHPPLCMEAYMLYMATISAQSNIDTITFILATHTENEIEQIKDWHNKMYSYHLRDGIFNNTIGIYRDAVLSLLEPKIKIDADDEAAAKFAIILNTNGIITKDTAEFISTIFCKSSQKTILKVLKEYKKLFKKELYESFSKEKPFEKLIYSIIKYNLDPAKYIASYLYEGITDKNIDKIITVVVTHYHIDMGHVADTYLSIYGRRLEDQIFSTFSSHSNSVNALLMLLGKI